MSGNAPSDEEMFAVLFRIFKTWQQRQAVGHDLAMAVRSIIRRGDPVAYTQTLDRWPDTKPSQVKRENV